MDPFLPFIPLGPLDPLSPCRTHENTTKNKYNYAITSHQNGSIASLIPRLIFSPFMWLGNEAVKGNNGRPYGWQVIFCLLYYLETKAGIENSLTCRHTPSLLSPPAILWVLHRLLTQEDLGDLCCQDTLGGLVVPVHVCVYILEGREEGKTIRWMPPYFPVGDL